MTKQPLAASNSYITSTGYRVFVDTTHSHFRTTNNCGKRPVLPGFGFRCLCAPRYRSTCRNTVVCAYARRSVLPYPVGDIVGVISCMINMQRRKAAIAPAAADFHVHVIFHQVDETRSCACFARTKQAAREGGEDMDDGHADDVVGDEGNNDGEFIEAADIAAEYEVRCRAKQLINRQGTRGYPLL